MWKPGLRDPVNQEKKTASKNQRIKKNESKAQRRMTLVDYFHGFHFVPGKNVATQEQVHVVCPRFCDFLDYWFPRYPNCIYTRFPVVIWEPDQDIVYFVVKYLTDWLPFFSPESLSQLTQARAQDFHPWKACVSILKAQFTRNPGNYIQKHTDLDLVYHILGSPQILDTSSSSSADEFVVLD